MDGSPLRFKRLFGTEANKDLLIDFLNELLEMETKEVFYEKLTYVYLEMPKFNKEIKQLETHFDRWLYVLKNLPRFQRIPKALQERIFKKLFSTAEIANYTPEEMNAYEQSLKTLRDNYATSQYVEKTVADAKEMVREAEKKAKEAEKKKALAIASSMKQSGLDVELIMKHTGLGREEVEKL